MTRLFVLSTIVYAILCSLFTLPYIVESMTMSLYKVTPNKINYYDFPQPSFTMTMTFNDVGIEYGILTICNATMERIEADSFTETRLGTTLGSICFPIRDLNNICGTNLARPSVNISLILDVYQTDGTKTVFNLTNPTPDQYAQVTYDHTVPSIIDIQYSSTSRIIYCKVKFSNTNYPNSINMVYSEFTAGTSTTNGFFEHEPDGNNYYYMSYVTPNEDQVYLFKNIRVRKYTSDPETIFTINKQFVVKKDPFDNLPYVSSVINYTLTPNTITNFQVDNYVRYDLFVTKSLNPIYDLTSISFNTSATGSYCNPLITSEETISIYCFIPAFFDSGRFSLSFIPNYKGMPTQTPYYIRLESNGTLHYTNSISSSISQQQPVLSIVQNLNQPEPFGIQLNVSFTSANPFYTGLIQMAGFITYLSPTNIIEGTVTNGIISVLFEYNYILNYTSIDITLADSTGFTSKSSYLGPVITPIAKPQRNMIFEPSYFSNLTIDYLNRSNPATLPMQFRVTSDLPIVGGVGGVSSTFNYFTPMADTKDQPMNQSFVSGTNTAGYYFTTLPGYKNNDFNFRGYGANTATIFTKYGSFQDKQSLYGKCIDVIGPKSDVMPQMTSFTINPNLVDVTNSEQTVKFTVQFSNIGAFLPDYIKVYADVYYASYYWEALCYPTSKTSTTRTFACTKVFAKNSFSGSYPLMVDAYTWAGYYVKRISPDTISMNQFPRSLNILGQPFAFGYIPILNQVSFNPTTNILSFDILQSDNSTGIESLDINVRRGGKSFNVYSIKPVGYPRMSVNGQASLNIPCSAPIMSSLLSGDWRVDFTIKDSNSKTYVFPYSYIKEKFPFFTLSGIKTCGGNNDQIAPVVSSFQLPIANVTTANNQVSITLNVGITDNLSGFKNMTLVIGSATTFSEEYTINSTHLISGDNRNGQYSFQISLPVNATTGSYPIYFKHVYDNNENDRSYRATDLGFFLGVPYAQINVVNSNQTVLQPYYKSLSFSNGAVANKGESIVIDNISTNHTSRVFVLISESTTTKKIEATKIGDNLFQLTYQPTYFGYHYIGLVLYGNYWNTYGYTPALLLANYRSFRYTGNDITLPIGLSDVSSQHNGNGLVIGQFILVNDDIDTTITKRDCILSSTGVTPIKTYVVPMVRQQSADNVYTCTVNLPNVPSSPVVYMWSLHFNLNYEADIPLDRYISSLDIQQLYSLSPNITIDSVPVTPTPDPTQQPTIELSKGYQLVVTFTFLFTSMFISLLL